MVLLNTLLSKLTKILNTKPSDCVGLCHFTNVPSNITQYADDSLLFAFELV